MPELRMTLAVARVLREFLDDPWEPRYGYDLMRATGFPSGKLYPILAKLVDAGHLVRSKEQIDPSREGRPARRIYRLSDRGMLFARRELISLSEQIAPPEPHGPLGYQFGPPEQDDPFSDQFDPLEPGIAHVFREGGDA